MYRSYLLKLNSICGHFLTVNTRRYGRCYVKIIIPLCTFLKFYTHLIQQDRFKMLLQVSKGFKYFFKKHRIFDECRHYSAYRAPFNKVVKTAGLRTTEEKAQLLLLSERSKKTGTADLTMLGFTIQVILQA